MSWTTQARKGALELAVLNALNGDRLYGYDIVRILRRHEGLMIADGTVYPILSRLKADGLVQATIEDSPDGPPRKYYQLTPAGRDAITEMNQAWDSLVTSLEQLRHAEKAGTR
jgi:PadR family transcriptional regulator, regulatory protein PadR